MDGQPHQRTAQSGSFVGVDESVGTRDVVQVSRRLSGHAGKPALPEDLLSRLRQRTLQQTEFPQSRPAPIIRELTLVKVYDFRERQPFRHPPAAGRGRRTP